MSCEVDAEYAEALRIWDEIDRHEWLGFVTTDELNHVKKMLEWGREDHADTCSNRE